METKKPESMNAMQWFKEEYCENCEIDPEKCGQMLRCLLANILHELTTQN